MKLITIFLILFMFPVYAIESFDYFYGYPLLRSDEAIDLKKSDYVNQNEERCPNVQAKQTYYDVFIETGKTKEVLLDSSKVLTKLKEVDLINGILNFKFESKKQYRKYEVPILVKVQKISNEAMPISSAFMGLFTLGLYPILNPKEFAQRTIGCNDNNSVDFVYDANNKKETISTIEMPFDAPENDLVIRGLEQEEKFITTYSDHSYDLTNSILQNDIKNITEIRIFCKSCIEPDTEYKLAYNFEEFKEKMLKKIKADEIAAIEEQKKYERKRKEDEIKYQKQREEAANKILKEKEAKDQLAKDLKAREQKDKISQAKQKCSDLGFSPSTDKHGNCVLELIK
jgi:hypothetical protein